MVFLERNSFTQKVQVRKNNIRFHLLKMFFKSLIFYLLVLMELYII